MQIKNNPTDSTEMEMTGWTQKRANSIIAIVSMAWGASYILMKVGLDGIQPFNMIALRFGIAFLVTALIFIKKVMNSSLLILGYGAVLGLILFGIFSFIMYGLKTTTASTAGFLTSTTVVFVPILQMLITGKKPKRKVIIGTALTIIGIAFLTMQDSLKFNRGALLCVLGAFTYAWHIIITDRFTHKADGLLLGIYQLGFAGLYGLIANLIFENQVMPSGTLQWGAVLGLALICSAFGFVMQPIAQKHTTPEHTGLLFALEPVSSAIFAFIFFREVLSIRAYVGAALVLLSVFLSSINDK